MTVITAYLMGVTVLTALWAWRVPHEDVRTVFILSLVWPLTLVFVIAIAALNMVNWNLDVVQGTKRFGFRRPTNPQARGWALTLFGQEIQIYRVG